MIFVAFDDTLASQLADLSRQTASIDLKIVCKLLSVKRNIKAVFGIFLGFNAQISHQLFTGRSFGSYFYFLVKIYRFAGKLFHQIVYKPLMKSAVVGASV